MIQTEIEKTPEKSPSRNNDLKTDTCTDGEGQMDSLLFDLAHETRSSNGSLSSVSSYASAIAQEPLITIQDSDDPSSGYVFASVCETILNFRLLQKCGIRYRFVHLITQYSTYFTRYRTFNEFYTAEAGSLL